MFSISITKETQTNLLNIGRPVCSTMIAPISLRTDKGILCFLLFFMGFTAAQRFSFPIMSASICLLPIGLAIVLWRHAEIRNLLIIVALLVKVDLGDDVFATSLVYIRLIIVALGLLVLLEHYKPKINRICAFAVIALVPIVGSIVHADSFDIYTFVRDLLVMGIIGVILTDPRNAPKIISQRNLQCLHYVACGQMASELINIYFFYVWPNPNYLNYDSVKCFIALSTFYKIAYGKYKSLLYIVPITVIVLVYYSSRMVLITYFIITAILFVRIIHKNKKGFIVAVLLCLFIGVSWKAINDEEIQGNRVFDMLIDWKAIGGASEYFQLVDPVRFAEHKLLFARNPLRILFGDGLGAGFKDRDNSFHFVRYNQGAFSEKEIDQGIYFRLHDTWISLGLRFGLLVVLILYAYLFRQLWNRSMEVAFASSMSLMMVNCALFSTAGTIVAGIWLQQMYGLSRQKKRFISDR